MQQLKQLPSDQLLALAIAVEEANIRMFEELSDRFQTFDDSVSQMMNALAEEECHYENRLKTLFSHKYQPIDPNIYKTIIQTEIKNFVMPNSHFFIINQSIAHKTLWMALKIELRIREFYDYLSQTVKDSDLLHAFQDLLIHEDNHVELIQKKIAAISHFKT